MRKTQKSALYELFEPLSSIPVLNNKVHVIDGGFLLHRVVWNKDSTFKQIIQQYITYLLQHYPGNTWIIFDGYADEMNSTKNNERIRRLEKNACVDISITSEIMKPSVNQKFFYLIVKIRKAL